MATTLMATGIRTIIHTTIRTIIRVTLPSVSTTSTVVAITTSAHTLNPAITTGARTPNRGITTTTIVTRHGKLEPTMIVTGESGQRNTEHRLTVVTGLDIKQHLTVVIGLHRGLNCVTEKMSVSSKKGVSGRIRGENVAGTGALGVSVEPAFS